jgi:hypothetical protein
MLAIHYPTFFSNLSSVTNAYHPFANVCHNSALLPMLAMGCPTVCPPLQSREPNSLNCSTTSSERKNLLQLLFVYALLVSEPDAGVRRGFCWIQSRVDFLRHLFHTTRKCTATSLLVSYLPLPYFSLFLSSLLTYLRS